MKPKISPTLLLAVFSICGFSQTVLADHGSCTEEVETLQSALNENICYYGSRFFQDERNAPKVCKGLNKKLVDTVHKLHQEKYRDANRKLADFGATLEDLAMRKKPKLTEEEYLSLGPAYHGAEGCVGPL